jgi:hypothetical protein
MVYVGRSDTPQCIRAEGFNHAKRQDELMAVNLGPKQLTYLDMDRSFWEGQILTGWEEREFTVSRQVIREEASATWIYFRLSSRDVDPNKRPIVNGAIYTCGWEPELGSYARK